MEKAEIINFPPEGLAIFLAQYCEDRDNYNHFRKLTEDELNEKREEFTNRAMNISKIEIELAITKKSFKNRLEPLYELQDEALQILEAGEDEFNTSVYPIYDFETGMMELYNFSGILLKTRLLTSVEMQRKLALVDGSAAETFKSSISDMESEFAEFRTDDVFTEKSIAKMEVELNEEFVSQGSDITIKISKIDKKQTKKEKVQ